jgi:hypothetical protein
MHPSSQKLSDITHSNTMNYPYNVPSVVQIHPVLANNPDILNVQALQGVYASKAIRNPVDLLAITESENTVEVLSGARSEDVFNSPWPQLMYQPISARQPPWSNHQPNHRNGQKPCAHFEGNPYDDSSLHV